MFLENQPSLAVRLHASGSAPGREVLRIGDLLVYSGSRATHRGPAVYRGLCQCTRRCRHDARARVEVLCADGAVIRHVHCHSFERARGQTPDVLRAAADRLRAERVLIEVSLIHAVGRGAAPGADPDVIAWHPIAADRGPGACRASGPGPRCPRCASAALVRAGIEP
jgi:hypothetical protein